MQYTRNLRQAKLAAIVLVLAGCCKLDPFCVDPGAVLQKQFAPPVSDARIIAGSGAAWQGHDVWAVFDTAQPVRPVTGLSPVPVACDEPRAWFAKQLGAQASLAATPGLQCRGASDPKKSYSNGVWLLHDPTARRYFYRSWSHS